MRGRGVLQRWRSAIPVLQACGKEENVQPRRWLASDASGRRRRWRCGRGGGVRRGSWGWAGRAPSARPRCWSFSRTRSASRPCPAPSRPTQTPPPERSASRDRVRAISFLSLEERRALAVGQGRRRAPGHRLRGLPLQPPPQPLPLPRPQRRPRRPALRRHHRIRRRPHIWVWRVWRIGSWDLRESAGAEACGWKRRGHEQHRPHCVWGAHTAAVSASGSVFTWGRDEGEGRLGYIPGPRYEDGTCVPEQVRGIPDSTAAVACGGFFTMALTSAGQLWSWGGNSNYELGTGDRRASWRPRVVPEVESTRLTQVACGGYHSAALTEDGKVLTWGHGGHGQLGHGDLANTKTPKVVEALEGQRAVSVACGGAWTTAVTESGDLYTWGKNRDCQLGVSGLMDTEMLPIRVDLAAEPDQAPDSSRRAIAVASGAHHGMCLVLRT